MSKELEALEYLINNEYYDNTQAYEIVKQALKRNEPISPTLLPNGKYECSNCLSVDVFADEKGNIFNPNFCSHCGQALKWE